MPGWRSLVVLALALPLAPLSAQTLDDGLLVPRRELATGFLYARDSWSQYWEGTLKRNNGNIGTLTTQTVTWLGGVGLSDRLSLLAMLPYVRTHASQGVLHDMNGLQDLTLGAKYQLLSRSLRGQGTLRAIAVAAVGIPVSDYTPDFQPLSIGLASRRLTGRFTLNYEAQAGWLLNGSAGYTWRSKVTLDRPAYYTDGELVLSDEVVMHDVLDWTLTAGYRTGRLYLPLTLAQQRTLGGGDIRRQDMPFVNNRMNYVKLDGSALYALDHPNLAFRLGVTRVLSGRNVGQATTLTGGMFYRFHF